MPEPQTVVEPAAAETANQTEKQLIEKFIAQKKVVEDMTLELKESTKLRDDLEARLMQLLEVEGKAATAKYEGLGHCAIITGAAHASIQKGMADSVKDYLKSIGREDIVKETIAAASLSAFVRECLSQNKELPNGVTFYSPKWINFYPIK